MKAGRSRGVRCDGDDRLLGTRRFWTRRPNGSTRSGGLSHIMAISGLHISVIGMTLYHFLRKRGLPFGVSGLCAGVLLYGQWHDGGNGGVRAARSRNVCAASVGADIGRSYDSINALGLMALVLRRRILICCGMRGFSFSLRQSSALCGLAGCVLGT